MSHDPHYDRNFELEPALNDHPLGHPSTLGSVLAGLRDIGVPPGCVAEIEPGMQSCKLTRMGRMLNQALNYCVLPADNAPGFPTVLATSSFTVHGLDPSSMPNCGALVNIGLAVPTLSCIACMNFSGGSVKYNQVAITDWIGHLNSDGHGRRDLRFAYKMSLDPAPREGVVLNDRVLAYFNALALDDRKYAQALHHALYIYTELKRHFSPDRLEEWEAGNVTLESAAADRALTLGRKHVGIQLRWEGAERWELAQKAAAVAKAAKRGSKVESKAGDVELLASTQAGDATFIQGMPASRRVRLSAMLREQEIQDKKAHAETLAREASELEQ